MRPDDLAPLQFIREKYWEYEYEEVVTPNLFNFELWQRSGHADHYKENMFLVDIEGAEFGLKPMNCPGAPPPRRHPVLAPTARRSQTARRPRTCHVLLNRPAA